MKRTAIALIFFLLVSCAPAANTPKVSGLPSPAITLTPRPSVTPYPTPTRAPTLTPEMTPTLAGLKLVQNEFSKYTISAIRAHPYGGGQVEDLQVMGKNKFFTRHYIRYQSDGLNIYGFANIPNGKGPYPVIVMIHGYVDPATYQTLDYTTDAADDLASRGYMVLHPNMRNFPPSDQGDALFRTGYAIDVINLIADMRENAGKPGLFENADASRIGLWGHSMGGDIALKVAVSVPSIRAVLLYSSMSGDEKKNSETFKAMTGSADNLKELTATDQDFDAISPDRYYSNIHAAVQMHAGTDDIVVPLSSAKETCQKLQDAGVDLRCFYYDGADHTFLARYLVDFLPKVYAFFDKYLVK